MSHRPAAYGGVGSVRWDFFAGELPKHGWEVHSVTARPNVTGDPLSTDPNVAKWSERRRRAMWRVGRAADPVAGSLGVRPEAFPASFGWMFTGRRSIDAAIVAVRPQIVVATSPPPVALFAAASAARRGRLPFVADLRDMWAGHPAYDTGGQLLTRLEARPLRRAAFVSCVTAPMQARVGELHPDLRSRLELLPNGFDPQLLKLRSAPRRPEPGERLTFIHAGAMFADRSARELVAALGQPDIAPRVRLVLHGNLDAATEQAVRDAPADLDVATVPPLPWNESVQLVSKADVSVVIVSPDLGDEYAWPVKMLEGLAMGKQILALTTGGAAEALLRELGQDDGCCRYDDIADVASAVRRLLDDPGRPVPPEDLSPWNRALVAGRLAALLDVAAASGDSREATR